MASITNFFFKQEEAAERQLLEIKFFLHKEQGNLHFLERGHSYVMSITKLSFLELCLSQNGIYSRVYSTWHTLPYSYSSKLVLILRNRNFEDEIF